MKNKLVKGFAFFATLLVCFVSQAQNPTFTCSIADAKVVSANEYEFDVILTRTGETEFRLSFFQLGILINPAIIPGGATIKVSPVPGSSSLLNEMQPGSDRFSFDDKFKCIRIAPVAPKTPNIYTVISNAENGTRLFRIRITCSKNFNNGVSTNHSWNFTKVSGYETIIFARVGTTTVINTNITSKDSFVKSIKSASDVTFKY